jgi:TATA-box binding protein (TBP) (component of TFIID and TFIIIB)
MERSRRRVVGSSAESDTDVDTDAAETSVDDDADESTASVAGAEAVTEEDAEQYDMKEHLNTAFEDDIEAFLDEEDDDAAEDDAATTTDLVVHSADGKHHHATPRNIVGLITVLNNVVTATLTLCPAGTPTASLVAMRIDLMEVILYGARLGFQLNTRRFAAAILSCLKPTCCVLIFAKGKMVCAGCANLADATRAIEKTVGYLRSIRPQYAQLRAADIRIRNMVGTMCVPYNIDVKRLQAENPRVVENPIANGVKISSPGGSNVVVDDPIDTNRKKQRRKTGTALVYHSGYLLFIGAKSADEMRESFNRVYPIASRYFVGSAEKSFANDKQRRFYTSLRVAAENSALSPESFIAVRDDGTQGTVDEWRVSNNVAENVERYRDIANNPDASNHSRPMIDSTMDTKAIVDAENSRQLQLVVSGAGAGALVASVGGGSGALINAAHGDALSMIKASNASKKNVLLLASAKNRIKKVEERTALRVLVDQTCNGSAVEAVQRMKPKHTNLLSADEASGLYQGRK